MYKNCFSLLLRAMPVPGTANVVGEHHGMQHMHTRRTGLGYKPDGSLVLALAIIDIHVVGCRWPILIAVKVSVQVDFVGFQGPQELGTKHRGHVLPHLCAALRGKYRGACA